MFVLLDRLVLEVHRECLAPTGFLERMAYRPQRLTSEVKELKEDASSAQEAHLVRREFPVRKDHQVWTACQGRVVTDLLLGCLVHQGQWEILVHQERLAMEELMEHPERMQKAAAALQDAQALLGRRVRPDQLETTAHQEVQVRQVLWDLLESPVHLEILDSMDHQALKESEEYPGMMGYTVLAHDALFSWL